MFGLGFLEVLVVGILALVLIGPEDLPKLARTIGKFVNELKRGRDSLTEEFRKSTSDIRKPFEEVVATVESSKISLLEERKKIQDLQINQESNPKVIQNSQQVEAQQANPNAHQANGQGAHQAVNKESKDGSG